MSSCVSNIGGGAGHFTLGVAGLSPMTRMCFRAVDPKDLTPKERKQYMESLIFLTRKRDRRIKTRACANDSMQKEWMNCEEASSPTVITESILMTATIEAEEGRDMVTVDIPTAFIQTSVETKGNNKIMMKIRGPLVNILVQLDPNHYGP